MTEGHIITATATNNFTAAPTVSDSGVVPANGTVHITGKLTANTTEEVESVISIIDDNGSPGDTTDDQTMTITINQAEPTAPAAP